MNGIERVVETIKDLYGDVPTFEAWARLELGKYVVATLGDHLGLPCMVIIRGILPLAVAVIFDMGLAHLRKASVSRCLHYLVGWLILLFLHVPIVIKLVEIASGFKLRAESKLRECTLCAGLALCLANIFGVYGIVVRFFLGEIVWLKVAASVAALLGHMWLFDWQGARTAAVRRSGFLRGRSWQRSSKKLLPTAKSLHALNQESPALKSNSGDGKFHSPAAILRSEASSLRSIEEEASPTPPDRPESYASLPHEMRVFTNDMSEESYDEERFKCH